MIPAKVGAATQNILKWSTISWSRNVIQSFLQSQEQERKTVGSVQATQKYGQNSDGLLSGSPSKRSKKSSKYRKQMWQQIVVLHWLDGLTSSHGNISCLGRFWETVGTYYMDPVSVVVEKWLLYTPCSGSWAVSLVIGSRLLGKKKVFGPC